jgi:hypothetical protein
MVQRVLKWVRGVRFGSQNKSERSWCVDSAVRNNLTAIRA